VPWELLAGPSAQPIAHSPDAATAAQVRAPVPSVLLLAAADEQHSLNRAARIDGSFPFLILFLITSYCLLNPSCFLNYSFNPSYFINYFLF
jgi:hypothetical protein